MFSTTCKYAIRAMLYLAINTSEEKKVGVDEIATALNVPKHFLAKILQQLTKYELATSSKGRNGGFYLTKENSNGTLLPIIEAIEGPNIFSGCILGLPECSGENPCSLHNQALNYRNGLLETLGTESIADTASRINEFNLKL
ncbi:MAG: Rrf2 family transcriptional regulator [Saprospiraceae bacterium]|nr:Rrf2 family transcriptional regulator [Saprospiraceae bacterium]